MEDSQQTLIILENVPTQLKSRTYGGGQVYIRQDKGFLLEIPAGPANIYRLAQIDDYSNLKRNSFPWQAPLHLSLSARSSQKEIPGTWGFGLWNDPFSFSSGLGGGVRLLPCLPNAVWFFFASQPNYLSLFDDAPGYGNLAATFRSPTWHPLILAAGALSLPSLVSPGACRLLRRVGRKFISQSSRHIPLDNTQFHRYNIYWESESVKFTVDENVLLETEVVPQGRLGFVLWIDNQYLSLSPEKPLSFGSLPNQEVEYVEIREFSIEGE
jgi:hypothetical protein